MRGRQFAGEKVGDLVIALSQAVFALLWLVVRDHVGFQALRQLAAVAPGDFRQGKALLVGEFMQLPVALGAVEIADKALVELPVTKAAIPQGADLGLFGLTHCRFVC